MGESLGRWHGECPWVVREQEDRLKTSHVCYDALWRASGWSQFKLGYGNTGGPESQRFVPNTQSICSPQHLFWRLNFLMESNSSALVYLLF